MIINNPCPGDTPELRALWQEAFGDTDSFLDTFFGTAYSIDRARCVKINGEIVAALYWFDCEHGGGRVAYLYAIATKKAFRGRGFSSLLIKNTHKVLEDLGYVGALLVPSEESLFGFYRRLGYETATYVGELKVSASDKPLEIRRIAKEEYARRRRLLLPKGGVVQENENLTFLEAQAELYAGDGIILAASRHADILRGLEFIGDTDKAPSVLKALGCKTGKFRIPSGKIPFSMFCPLSDGRTGAPSYFGLAFD